MIYYFNFFFFTYFYKAILELKSSVIKIQGILKKICVPKKIETKLQHPSEKIDFCTSTPVLIIRKITCSKENVSQIQILLDNYTIQTCLEDGCLQFVFLPFYYSDFLYN